MIKLERNNDIVFEKQVNNELIASKTISKIEVLPGDILTITHANGNIDNNSISVYPGEYKDNYISNDGKSLKYRITNTFGLVPCN